MPVQAKTEPLEFLYLETTETVFAAFTLLHGMGYRGSLSTVAGVGARMELSMSDAVTVSAAVGDVILYRAEGPTVIACMSLEAFTAGYDII